MNIEFHYYILFILCKKAGFSEYDSQIISYSSQYMDNNLVPYTIEAEGQRYETIPTQNYGWWKEDHPKNLYIPFHFLPGDPEHPGAARKDGKKNRFNCTPNSSRAKALLVEGLKTRNLYRVGIALHTYADTWAHQNFSGIKEDWNRTEKRTPVPPIGHAQVLRAADNIGGTWTDPRLVEGHVVNKERFMAAARKIYKYLCTYNHRDFDDHDLVIDSLNDLINTRNTGREERITDYIIAEEIIPYDKYEWFNTAVHNPEGTREDKDGFIAYDKLLWLKDAFLYRNELARRPVLQAREGFYHSHWYYWQEAAKGHLNAAHQLLKDLFHSREVM